MVNMSDIHKCGFCDLLTGLLRRVMCLWNGRGSSESCYRELDDQETLVHERFSAEGATASSITPVVSSSEYEEEEQFPEDEYGDPAVTFEMVKRTFAAPWQLERIPGEMLFKEKERMGRLGRFKSMPELKEESTSMTVQALLDSSYPHKIKLLFERNIHKWDFDTHMMNLACGDRILPLLCMHLFKHYGLIEFFNLEEEKCAKLFDIINEAYHTKNMYHNAVHAADVTQAVHCFLQQNKFKKHFDKMDVMLVLLAAVTHDLDHPGVNQNFLTKTEHALYQIYKATASRESYYKKKKASKLREFIERLRVTTHIIRNGEEPTERSPVGERMREHFKQPDEAKSSPSILEHHHWRVAYSAILESGVFDHMQDLLPHMKSTLGSLILSTDITRQPTILRAFKRHVRRNTLDLRRRQHRLLVLQMALKTADISNPGRSWLISKKWSMKVCDEFFFQGDMERHCKVEISQLCDRNTESIPDIQIGFFKNIVSPLFKEWNEFCDDELSNKMVDNLSLNQYKWELEAFKISRKKFLTWREEALQAAFENMDLPSTSMQLEPIDEQQYLEDNQKAPAPCVPLKTSKKRQAPKTPTDRSSSYERPPSSDRENVITDADMVENDLVTYTNTSSEMSITFDSPAPSRRASLSPDIQSTSDASRRYSAPYHVRARSRGTKDSIPECLGSEEAFGSEACASGLSETTPITNSDVSIGSRENVQRKNSTSSEEYLIQVDGFSPIPLKMQASAIQGDCGVDPEDIEAADDNTGSTEGSSSSQKATSNFNCQFHELLASVSSHSSESRLYQPLQEDMPRELRKSDGERIFLGMFPRVLEQVLSRRRGSAPAGSEARVIASNLSLHHSLGDGLKPRQQWVTQAEASGSQRRRSSLPSEVITGRACVTA